MNEAANEVLKALAQEAQKLFPPPTLEKAPLHTKRRPLGKQEEAIDALYSAFLRGERILILSGKEGEGIGVGKTYVSIATSMALLHPKGRVLVICPPHIVKKWAREVKEDGGIPIVIDRLGEFLEMAKRPPEGLEYVIMSKDRAKRRAKLVTSYYRNRRGAFCPHCHAPLTGWYLGEFCLACGEPLYQQDNTDTPGLGDALNRFIKSLGFLILDEAHAYRSGETQQGKMAQSLMGKIPTLLLSGSLMGGFASDLYYILRKTSPHLLGEMTLRGGEGEEDPFYVERILLTVEVVWTAVLSPTPGKRKRPRLGGAFGTAYPSRSAKKLPEPITTRSCLARVMAT